MKRPSFQFYPGDWLRDMGLRGCSIEARGLWADLLCLMHDGQPYGHLATHGGPWSDDQGARATGLPLATYRRLLGELETAAVFSRDPRGAIYSRRMVKDEDLRQKRAAAGRTGGLATQARHQAPASVSDRRTDQANGQVGAQSNRQANGEADGEQLVADATADEEAGSSSGKGSGENQPSGDLAAILGFLPTEHHPVFDGYRGAARFARAFDAEILRLHRPITGGQAFPGETIGRALSMMAANGESFNAIRLAGYCRRLLEHPPAGRHVLEDDDEDEYTIAARKVREEATRAT